MAEFQSNASRNSYGAPQRTGNLTAGANDITGKAIRKEFENGNSTGGGFANGASGSSLSTGATLTAAPYTTVPVAAGIPAPAPIASSPLRSADTFESYCSQVQIRLAEHATLRISFLQSAYDRLTRLLHTARAVEDTALYNELWQHRVAVRELLEALSQVSSTPIPAQIQATVQAPAPTANQANPLLPSTPAPQPSNAPINGQAIPTPASNIAQRPGAPGFPPPVNIPARSVTGSPTGQNSNQNSNQGNSPGISLPERTPTPPTPAATAPAQPFPKTAVVSPSAPVGAANGHVRELPVNVAQPTEKPVAEKAEATAPPTETVRPVRHPVRPLTDIEADAVRLREQLRDWNQRHPLHITDGAADMLNVPNCLRLRAVACRMRRLEEEAGDTEVAEVTELGKDIEDLLDDAGDEEYTVALDYEIEPQPTAYQWGELAERYEETARAQEAFEWWIAHRSILSVADVQALAEAVAAIQQRFNRLLFRIGARDPFQQQLFDDLRVWAKEAQCYLYSLRPKVPIAELIDKAQSIDEAWEQAREPVRALEGRQEAVETVIQMVSAPDFGQQEEQDEARLQEALSHCKDLRIPASDRRLRDALLPWAAFLESDERCKELVREINLEWERRQETGKPEPMDDDVPGSLESLSTELEAVRKVTQGKRCLMLGGTCREENRRKIQEALQLTELVWPSTKPSDPLAKFDTDLRHSDIVALLTRFSRKEWKNSQDFCAREGKKFVHLTTGYGVAQVIRHFYAQIAPHE